MRMLAGALLVAAAAGLTASPSSAQYLGVPYYGQPPPYTGTYGTRETPYYGTRAYHHRRRARDAVTVTVPRAYERRAPGASIETGSLSRDVPLYDLDLRTTSGARELHDRVSDTASTLCDEVNTADNDACYRSAMRDAMVQVHQAIRNARGYSGY
jgi:UrcA family protein